MHSSTWRVFLVVAAVVFAPAPAVAADGLIGIYTDLSATQTALTFSVGVPRTLYVMARLDGQTAEGMSGAEYRVDGLPAGWVSVATPNPAAAVALGDPFNSIGGVRRANIAFQYCTGGSDSLELLHTVVIVPLSEISPTDLQVVVADPHRRAVGPAADRAGLVQVAQFRLRVERRAGERRVPRAS
jgi:hypothetical protein